MRKKICLSIMIIFLLLFSNCVYATSEDVMLISEEETEAVTTSEESEAEQPIQEYKTIQETYIMSDDNATLQDAIVDGNIFALGTNISLSNVLIYGDIFVLGQNITFSDITVYGTAFLGSETINMNNANFAGNIFSVSQTMTYSGIVQDIFAAAENITLNENASIARDAFMTADEINISGGTIGKNAFIGTDKLTVGPTVKITGDLNYSSKEEAKISSDSIIGNVNFNKVEEEAVEETGTTNTKVYNIIVIAIKSIFVCGFIFLFAKEFMNKQRVSNVATYLGVSTLKGIAWTIVIPIIGILLLFTGVTVGLSFTVFALYSIIFWASVPLVAIVITANLTAKQEYNAWRFFGYSLLVSIVIGALKQLPTIGAFITILVGVAAIGIIMASFKRQKNKVVKEENIEIVEEVKPESNENE